MHILSFFRFFASVPLATSMLNKRLTVLGTVMKNKPELPPEFTCRREFQSSLFAYHEGKQLCSYMATRTKCVVMLSTMHKTSDIDPEDNGKPYCIQDYNSTKYAVDRVDQMVNTFTCRRKNRRWPMYIYFNIMDLAALNAYFVWIHRNSDWNLHQRSHRRSLYLKDMAFEMMEPWIRERVVQHPRGANQPSVVRARQLSTGQDQPSTQQEQHSQGRQVAVVRGYCHLCVVRRRVTTVCSHCHRHLCPAHAAIVCNSCFQ